MVDTHRCIAVDIGGTKTAVTAFHPGGSSKELRQTRYFASGDYRSIIDILKVYLGEAAEPPTAIGLAIAGIVDKGTASLTNLPWRFHEDELRQLGFAQVLLLNDMSAVAAGTATLDADDLLCLQSGGAAYGEVTAILAPGTGLGEGFVFHTEHGLYPHGTEGGHADFGPVDEEQRALWQWMTRRTMGAISYEMVCAGPAIARLYDFYVEHGVDADPQTVESLRTAGDRTPIVLAAALAGACPASRKAIMLFLKLLGQEAANLIVKTYATRGLYLAGGILPRLAGRISFDPFLRGLQRTGHTRELVAGTPINLVLAKDIVLRGVAERLSRFLDTQRL
jgi:glucokinase